MRRPYQTDLQRVVDHFLFYLSNEPDPRTGISPRTRFYGSLPQEAKLLFPDVSNDVITRSVTDVIAVNGRQVDPFP